jgi:hypothetical protein
MKGRVLAPVVVLAASASGCQTSTSSGHKSLQVHEFPSWVVALVLVAIVVLIVAVVRRRR